MVGEGFTERQIALVRYLACSAVQADSQGVLLAPDSGIDPDKLRLVREMVLRERERKIQALLPMTRAYLGDRFAGIVRQFAAVSLPTSLSSFDHAEKFQAFLEEFLTSNRMDPTFLLDVSRFEIAIGRVRQPEEKHGYLGKILRLGGSLDCSVRALSRYEVVICRYNLRALFDGASALVDVERRETFLLVVKNARDRKLRVFELTTQVYRFLEYLQQPEGSVQTKPECGASDVELLERLGLIEIVS